MYRFFFNFTGNLCAQKPNKAQRKRASRTGVNYLCVYHKVVSTSSFILYPPFILLTHYLHQLPFSLLSPPLLEYAPPCLARIGIRNIKTVSPPPPPPPPWMRPLFRHWASSTGHCDSWRFICRCFACLPPPPSRKAYPPYPPISEIALFPINVASW